jgi:hypothetical protein
MSFGFSVGDFVGGAHLAYKLYNSFGTAKGSSKNYAEVISQLNIVHKVLLQVEQLRSSNQLTQSTLNALFFVANTTNEAMHVFLKHIESYQESLRPGGSGNVIKDGFKKVKWACMMPSQVSAVAK